VIAGVAAEKSQCRERVSSSTEQDGERGQQAISVPETSFSMTVVRVASRHSLGHEWLCCPWLAAGSVER